MQVHCPCQCRKWYRLQEEEVWRIVERVDGRDIVVVGVLLHRLKILNGRFSKMDEILLLKLRPGIIIVVAFQLGLGQFEFFHGGGHVLLSSPFFERRRTGGALSSSPPATPAIRLDGRWIISPRRFFVVVAMIQHF